VRRFVYSCVILLLAAFSSALARGGTEISITPIITSMSGYTKYVLDESGYVTTTAYGHVKSELNFPVGGTYVGAGLKLESARESRLGWSLEATYLVNTSDPSGKMADRDWITWRYYDGLWSYTISDVQLSAQLWSIEGRMSLPAGRCLSVGAVGGFQCRRFKEDVNNLDGFQIDYSGSGFDTTLHETGHVAYYSITWKTPYMGLFCQARPLAGWQNDLMAAFAPTWVSDKDLHILRNRDAQASGNGPGFIAKISSQYRLVRSGLKVCPKVGVSAEWSSFNVKGSQEIYYYGVDSFSDATAGTRVIGIPHQMTSRLFQLSLRLGVEF
jgi:hypothetical protein